MVENVVLLAAALGAVAGPVNEPEMVVMDEIVEETLLNEEIEGVEEQVNNAKVVLNEVSGGDVVVDVEEGKAGDVVTIAATPDFLHKIVEVKVNGNTLLANENGSYNFVLVEGDNVIETTFAFDNAQLQEIYKAIDSVKQNGVKSILTPSNVVAFCSWAINALLASGFFLTLLKCKKIKSATVKEISEALGDELKKTNDEETKRFLKEVLGPTITGALEKTDGIVSAIEVICRCLVLAQENTPEARLAIIKELTALNHSDAELSTKVKAIVDEEIAKREANKQETIEAIEELKQTNEKLSSNIEEDGYGKI